MDKKSYTLTLEFKNGNENLTGAHIAPPDVDMSDITSASVTVSCAAFGFLEPF